MVKTTCPLTTVFWQVGLWLVVMAGGGSGGSVFLPGFLAVAQAEPPPPEAKMAYQTDSRPDLPYWYDGVSYNKQALQFHLLSKASRQPDEFLKVFTFFKDTLDINYMSQGKGTGYLLSLSVFEHWDFLEPVLDLGADVNIQDNLGATALMYASYCGHFASVELLLKRGAVPTLTNHNGESAIDTAREGQQNRAHCRQTGQYTEVLDILTQAVERKNNTTPSFKPAPF